MALSDTFSNGVNWVKDSWSNFNLREISHKIGGTSAEAVQAAIYFGLSFSVGFLFKKYFKFVFGCLLASIVVIKVMEYNQLLNIDWEGIKLFLGLEQGADFNVLVNNIFDWIKRNILLFVASTVGFLVGYKLG